MNIGTVRRRNKNWGMHYSLHHHDWSRNKSVSLYAAYPSMKDNVQRMKVYSGLPSDGIHSHVKDHWYNVQMISVGSVCGCGAYKHLLVGIQMKEGEGPWSIVLQGLRIGLVASGMHGHRDPLVHCSQVQLQYWRTGSELPSIDLQTSYHRNVWLPQ